MKKVLKYRARHYRNLFLLAIALGFAISSCRKDVPIPDSSDSGSISFKVPAGWPAPFYNFAGNQVTAAGFELGRRLFYETQLSADNTVSCGTCHQSFAAFANADHAISHGVNEKLGKRNSPPLFNLAWYTSFMWDGGINHLEIQPLAPIQNPVEMDEKLDNVLNKLQADARYRKLFSDAYGTPEITSERMFKALAQFMGLMVSDQSKYDKYMRQESGIVMSSAELAGLEVFNQKCASCHKAPLFTDFSFRNKGLEVTALNDSGRAVITLDAADLHKFKVPTLRNLRYTGPYMHDGRLTTLDQVLDQMQHGVVESATLDPAMKGGIALSDADKSNLLAFLNTLNDETFVKDKRFFEPLP
jgi:cytochrome c peroxidase